MQDKAQFNKLRVLFVHPDPAALRELQRELSEMRRIWEMAFAASASGALAILATSVIDIIVTESSLPDMRGIELLKEVMDRFPHVVRILREESAGKDDSLQTAHQRLSKSVDMATLVQRIDRTRALRLLLKDESLVQMISRIPQLPSPPNVYFQVVKEMQSRDASLRTVGELIAQDVAMSAKVLRLVNSAHYGLRQQVTSPAHAVALLGLDLIQSLVLMAGIFSHYDKPAFAGSRSALDDLQRHSLRASSFARLIAVTEGFDKTMIDEVTIAGLMHDVGKLILLTCLPVDYDLLRETMATRHLTQLAAKEEVLGASHTAIGAYILGLWGFSSNILEACAYHHTDPQFPFTLDVLFIVRFADFLCYDLRANVTAADWYKRHKVNFELFSMEERFLRWYTRCQQHMQEEMEQRQAARL